MSFRACLPCSAAYSPVGFNAFSGICCGATPFGPFLPWALKALVSGVLAYALMRFASSSALCSTLRASAVIGQTQRSLALAVRTQESPRVFLLTTSLKILRCECPEERGSRSCRPAGSCTSCSTQRGWKYHDRGTSRSCPYLTEFQPDCPYLTCICECGREKSAHCKGGALCCRLNSRASTHFDSFANIPTRCSHDCEAQKCCLHCSTESLAD